MKRFAIICASPFLLILSACFGPTKTEVIRLTPPSDLTRPCKVTDPKPEAPTIRDLVASREAYREALAECDARVAAIREWGG